MTISSVGGQGVLSAQELWAAMQGSGGSSSTQATGFDESVKQEIMDEFDADGDGTLSEEELQALQEKLDAMQEMMAMMHRMRMGQGGPGGPGGAEGGGGLLGELMAELEESGETDLADTDGDGVVSPEELMDYFGIDESDRPQGPPPAPGGEAASGETEEGSQTSVAGAAGGSSDSTEEADLNGDGVVTFAEWMEYTGMSTEGSLGQQGSTSSLLRRAMAAYASTCGEREEQSGQGIEALLGLGSSGLTAVA